CCDSTSENSWNQLCLDVTMVLLDQSISDRQLGISCGIDAAISRLQHVYNMKKGPNRAPSSFIEPAAFSGSVAAVDGPTSAAPSRPSPDQPPERSFPPECPARPRRRRRPP